MLNFNKKKYVSFDNLNKFSGMIQRVLGDKLKNVEVNLNERIDSRFKSLTAKEQADSEVVEAREGKVSLVENLKTYTKKKEHLELYEEVKGMYSEINNTRKAIDANSQHINILDEEAKTNKPIIQKVNDFVDAFRCEFKFVSSTNGYIKFPNILSGALIQWGYVTIPSGNETTVCTLNKPFSDFNYCFHLTPYMTNGVYSTVHTNGVTENSINVVLKGVNGNNPGGGLYWFAIGR